MTTKLSIGDRVMYRQNDTLYEGVIKSIQGDKIEIDDKTIEIVVVAVSKNTIADNILFSRNKKKGCSNFVSRDVMR